MKAMIQDILRCSLHDGPGIRTTVFFKGCPLHCVWCHNPETHFGGRQLRFYEDRCKFCGSCVTACPAGAHDLGDIHRIDRKKCAACGNCVEICCYDALELVGNEMTLGQVLEEVRKDKPFYKEDGGVTFSGGEPLLYADFVEEAAGKCREEGIGTAIETCGCVPGKNLEKILPLMDVVMFDYKLDTQKDHDKYTGGNYPLIMENLAYASSFHEYIILRCPVIPGINDTGDHFKEIARLSQSSPNIRQTQLMAYHSLGRGKWEQMGMKPRCEEDILHLKTVEQNQKKEWIEKLRGLGGKNIC